MYDKKYSYWYKAPIGELSNNRQKIIDKHNIIQVVSDAFAHDTAIPDPKWISNYVLKKTRHGSVIFNTYARKGIH